MKLIRPITKLILEFAGHIEYEFVKDHSFDVKCIVCSKCKKKIPINRSVFFIGFVVECKSVLNRWYSCSMCCHRYWRNGILLFPHSYIKYKKCVCFKDVVAKRVAE